MTFRFRMGFVLLFLLIAARVYIRSQLKVDLSGLPLQSIWDPPRRNQSPDLVFLVEFLNYCYAFLFLLWLRDGLVLSLDFVGLRIQDAMRKMRPRRQFC